jgi:hypothetical protein
VTTLYYLVEKHKGFERAREAVARLLEMFEILPVNRQVLELALQRIAYGGDEPRRLGDATGTGSECTRERALYNRTEGDTPR